LADLLAIRRLPRGQGRGPRFSVPGSRFCDQIRVSLSPRGLRCRDLLGVRGAPSGNRCVVLFGVLSSPRAASLVHAVATAGLAAILDGAAPVELCERLDGATLLALLLHSNLRG